MKELVTRGITGTLYVTATLIAAWSGPFTTALLFLPVSILCAIEFHRLYHVQEERFTLFWSALLAAVIHLAVALLPWFTTLRTEWIVAFVMPLIVISLAWMLFTGVRSMGHAFGGLLLVMAYIALPFALLPHFFRFGAQGNGAEVLIGTFILLWTNDTGAYLVGRPMGRHKLLPSVSPGKTVEGLAGGILLSLVVAWLLGRVWPVLPLRDWMICAVIVSVTGTVGDLLESSMKRGRGVKDSGSLLPGHGGFMDRFDGFLLAIPSVFAYLLLVR